VHSGRMEGCAIRPAKENVAMDVKGAKELARVLAERRGGAPEVSPVAALQAPDAAPLFHWVGVEPPTQVDPEEGAS
jgi:hypothetical protein